MYPPRLLYVEADEANWRIALLRLSPTYELTRARTAEEACRALRQPQADYGLVLIDVELRGSDIDGVRFASLLRGRLAETAKPHYARGLPLLAAPILFMTTFGASYPMRDLHRAGGNQVLTKPVELVALNLALAQVRLDCILKDSAEWSDAMRRRSASH